MKSLLFILPLVFSSALLANHSQVDEFYGNHTADSIKKYCNEDKSACRTIVNYIDKKSLASVSSFQISLVRTIKGKEVNATELFIYTDGGFIKYKNATDGIGVLSLEDVKTFRPDGEAEPSTIIFSKDNSMTIEDFVVSGHDIRFSSEDVQLYSPEGELLEGATLPISKN